MANTRNYFEEILSNKLEIQQVCLEHLVEDINETKERTISSFLNDSGSEDFLWALLKLLSSKEQRISSNAAYVIGSLAETELGTNRVLSLMKGRLSGTMMKDLTDMLISDDAECVMNSAGTLGTLAETEEGRTWMLSQPCIYDTITRITDLLSYENSWTASNAALVLARLTISEEGCQKALKHENSAHILTRLIQSLGNDAAGRGMNAAFAIGRLLDMSPGKERLLNCPETEKMITTLCRMLTKGDNGSAKNACFAVSCLATEADGNQRVLSNSSFNDVLNRLLLLLTNDEDIEAAWFAAMTLRTLSSHTRGVFRLREGDTVLTALNKNLNKPTNSKELNEEIHKTLSHLKKLEAPNPPELKVIGPTSIQATWDAIKYKNNSDVIYKLCDGSKIVYKGKECFTVVTKLAANTSYSFKLKVCAFGDDSPYSINTSATTGEDLPTAPCCFRVVGTTPTQIRVSWNPPEFPNGVLRGYSVFLGDRMLESTLELSYIFSRLQANSSYSLHVCATSAKGNGEKATLQAQTAELGAHAPGRPSVTVIGRNEVHVTWNAPIVPLGRFFRYELLANKEVIFSGTDKVFYATSLTPDTEYSFTVCAITSDGRCESEPTKKKTQKDKSQAEPGRHKLKTHSFKAKEFQNEKTKEFLLEKAKTQISISRPKQKKKRNLARPSSCLSNLSGKSLKYEHRVPEHRLPENRLPENQVPEHQVPEYRVPGSDTEGSWAINYSTTSSASNTHEHNLKTYKKSNPAVLSGAPLKNFTTNSHKDSPTRKDMSVFLRKTKSEYPLRPKPMTGLIGQRNKLLIEPISWNELLSMEDTNQQKMTTKRIIPKHKLKPSKIEPLENEKSFINFITNRKPELTALPKMTFIDKYRNDSTDSLTVHPDYKLMQEKNGYHVRKNTRLPSSNSSESSNDDSGFIHEPQTKDILRKLQPLSLADYHENRYGKSIARLKTPSSKGYWSDYDVYPTETRKKKGSTLSPINYKTFKGAHRPTKTFRHDSPLSTENWLSELPPGYEKNKYKFIPTQLRTQPAHLPKPVSGKHGNKMDTLAQLQLRQNTFKHLTRDGVITSPAENHNGGIPSSTKTFFVSEPKPTNHRSSPFRSNLLHDDTRCSPQRTLISGDPV